MNKINFNSIVDRTIKSFEKTYRYHLKEYLTDCVKFTQLDNHIVKVEYFPVEEVIVFGGAIYYNEEPEYKTAIFNPCEWDEDNEYGQLSTFLGLLSEQVINYGEYMTSRTYCEDEDFNIPYTELSKNV